VQLVDDVLDAGVGIALTLEFDRIDASE